MVLDSFIFITGEFIFLRYDLMVSISHPKFLGRQWFVPRLFGLVPPIFIDLLGSFCSHLPVLPAFFTYGLLVRTSPSWARRAGKKSFFWFFSLFTKKRTARPGRAAPGQFEIPLPQEQEWTFYGNLPLTKSWKNSKIEDKNSGKRDYHLP